MGTWKKGEGGKQLYTGKIAESSAPEIINRPCKNRHSIKLWQFVTYKTGKRINNLFASLALNTYCYNKKYDFN
jgi:hypothetical protein